MQPPYLTPGRMGCADQWPGRDTTIAFTFNSDFFLQEHKQLFSVQKLCGCFSHKEHVIMLTLASHTGTFWGPWAAGTLCTHMHVSTDIHAHTLGSSGSSEPRSDTRSDQAANARIGDAL